MKDTEMIPATTVPSSTPPKYLTTADVAVELNVSRDTVRRLIVGGELAASVVSLTSQRRVYRVSQWALRTYRERHQVRAGGSR